MPVDKQGKYWLPWPYKQSPTDKREVITVRKYIDGKFVDVRVAVAKPVETHV